MPGMQKYANITLKRGTFLTDNDFFNWWNITICLYGNRITNRTKFSFINRNSFRDRHNPRHL